MKNDNSLNHGKGDEAANTISEDFEVSRASKKSLEPINEPINENVNTIRYQNRRKGYRQQTQGTNGRIVEFGKLEFRNAFM